MSSEESSIATTATPANNNSELPSESKPQSQQQQPPKNTTSPPPPPPNNNNNNPFLKRWRLTRQNLSQNLQETFSVTSKSILQKPTPQERDESTLPPPPKGMMWVRDEMSREWRLKKRVNEEVVVVKQQVEEKEKQKKVEVEVVLEKLEGEEEKVQEKEEGEEEVLGKEEIEVESEEEEEEVITVEDLTITTQKEETKSQDTRNDTTNNSHNNNNSSIFRPRSNSLNSSSNNGGSLLLPPTHPVTISSSNIHPSYIPLSLPTNIHTQSKDSYSKGSKSKTSIGNNNNNNEDTWSFISEGNDAKSNSSSGIIISLSSSLRSNNNNNNNSSSFCKRETSGNAGGAKLPPIPPQPLERSWSSSTIASNDETGYGIPGIDYIEHVVLPTDTIEGICLQYKISRTRLRQANYFSGSTLLLAPKKLIIPLSKKAFREAVGDAGRVRRQNTGTQLYKIQAFLVEMGGGMSSGEAKTYLDLSNWDVDEALRTAYEDLAWEGEKKSNSSNAGQQELRITLSLHPSSKKKNNNDDASKNLKKDDVTNLKIDYSHYDCKKRLNGGEKEEESNLGGDCGGGGGGVFEDVNASGLSNESVVTATAGNAGGGSGSAGVVDDHGAQCVTPQDVYQASLSHDLCGVELKEISSPATSEGPDVMESAQSSPRMPSFPLPRI